KTNRNVFVSFVLCAPGGAAGDGQMSAHDGVGPHHAVFDGSQMHGSALAAQQPVVASHEFAQNFFDGSATGEGMGMAAIRTEREIARIHRSGTACRYSFLS